MDMDEGLVFGIRLENEDGSVIEGMEANMVTLTRVLPRPNDRAFRCLCFVDPHDNASFNYHQMGEIRREIATLLTPERTSEERSMLAQIDSIAQKGTIHTYLHFYGD
jgi:hypothetical protein